MVSLWNEELMHSSSVSDRRGLHRATDLAALCHTYLLLLVYKACGNFLLNAGRTFSRMAVNT